MVKRNRFIGARDILDQLDAVNVSETTIRSRIKESGEFKSYWACKKPFISPKNRKKRLAWAQEHLDWSPEQWMRVLWTDESPFVLVFNRRKRVWRLHNERYDPKCTIATVKHDKKINVWGCFAAHGVGDLYLVEGKLEQKQFKRILERHMLPSAERLFPDEDWIFQQDNDPKHTARSIQEWIGSQDIECFNWPAQSPDLNPIENLWSILDAKLSKRRPQNEQQLFEVLQEGWANLDVEMLTRLVCSLPDRCRAVIKAKGYPTKF